MAIRITKAHEPLHVEQIVTTIYGDPGVGKTSLAFTAEAPLLLDFDAGAYRSANRGDSVQVKRWADVASITAEDLADYKTIILDTAGRALDALTAHIIEKNPKAARSGGALNQQGWGTLKTDFTSFLRNVKSFGLDVVLVAHGSEQKDGDETRARIDVQGGSKDEIYKSSDAMGRLFVRDGKRVLAFSPTDTAFGKNPAGLDILTVPPFVADPHYLGDVINTIKTRLNSMSEEQRQVSQLLTEWSERVHAATSARMLNDLVKSSADLDPRIQKAGKLLLSRFAKDHDFVFDDKKGGFVEKPAEKVA